jgi:hypothetical protein
MLQGYYMTTSTLNKLDKGWRILKNTTVTDSNLTIKDIVNYSSSSWLGKKWCSIKFFAQGKGLVTDHQIERDLRHLGYGRLAAIQERALSILNQTNSKTIKSEAQIIENLMSSAKNKIVFKQLELLEPLFRFGVLKKMPEADAYREKVSYSNDKFYDHLVMSFLEDTHAKIKDHLSEDEFTKIVYNALEALRQKHAEVTDTETKKHMDDAIKDFFYHSDPFIWNEINKNKLLEIHSSIPKKEVKQVKLPSTEENPLEKKAKLRIFPDSYYWNRNEIIHRCKDPISAIDAAARILEPETLRSEFSLLNKLANPDENSKNSVEVPKNFPAAIEARKTQSPEQKEKTDVQIINQMLTEIQKVLSKCYLHYHHKGEAKPKIISDCRLVYEITRDIIEKNDDLSSPSQIINRVLERLDQVPEDKVNFPKEMKAYALIFLDLAFPTKT